MNNDPAAPHKNFIGSRLLGRYGDVVTAVRHAEQSFRVGLPPGGCSSETLRLISDVADRVTFSAKPAVLAIEGRSVSVENYIKYVVGRLNTAQAARVAEDLGYDESAE